MSFEKVLKKTLTAIIQFDSDGVAGSNPATAKPIGKGSQAVSAHGNDHI